MPQAYWLEFILPNTDNSSPGGIFIYCVWRETGISRACFFHFAAQVISSQCHCL